MPQDTNVVQNWWFSEPPSAWPRCSASLGLAVPQANERTAWVVVCSEFSWEMGGQETPYTFVPLFSFIQCTSLCPHQWNSVYVNETVWFKSTDGKIGKCIDCFCCPALLFPYFRPTMPQTSSLSSYSPFQLLFKPSWQRMFSLHTWRNLWSESSRYGHWYSKSSRLNWIARLLSFGKTLFCIRRWYYFAFWLPFFF